MDKQVYLSQWGGKISDIHIPQISKMLEKADASTLSSLNFINLKDPVIGLVWGIVLGGFGADRFYKGDMGLGILKLVLTISFIGIIVTGIWTIIDWFLVYKGIKEDNFNKISQVLILSNTN